MSKIQQTAGWEDFRTRFQYLIYYWDHHCSETRGFMAEGANLLEYTRSKEFFPLLLGTAGLYPRRQYIITSNTLSADT